MTQQELLASLRTYLGGELGEAAAQEIERLTHQVAWWKQAASTSRDDAHAWRLAANAKFEQPTIERIAQRLAEHGLTIVSGRDAEKIKRCGDCDALRKDAERYRWFRDRGSWLCSWTGAGEWHRRGKFDLYFDTAMEADDTTQKGVCDAG